MLLVVFNYNPFAVFCLVFGVFRMLLVVFSYCPFVVFYLMFGVFRMLLVVFSYYSIIHITTLLLPDYCLISVLY